MNRIITSLALVIVTGGSTVHAEEIDLALAAELDWLHAERIEMVEVVSKQKENKNTATGIVSVITHDEIERYGAK